MARIPQLAEFVIADAPQIPERSEQAPERAARERTRREIHGRLIEQEELIGIDGPAQVDGQFVYFTVEPWLIWHGARPLQLLAAPEPF